MKNVYRVGKKLSTTIYRDQEEQPCAWVPADPALAQRIVFLLNCGVFPCEPGTKNISENPPSSSVVPDHPPW